MRLESSNIARLLLLISIISNLHYRAEAQNEPLGRDRYQRVSSISEDSAGNFLLLNLQSNALLAAPSIQILNRQDGKTILLADFTGLVWSQDSRVFKPANRDIESIRLGQFQQSPPVVRISITSSNPAVFKRIEFANRGKALLIKFPERAVAYDLAAPEASRVIPESAADKKIAEHKARKLAISKLLPPVAPEINTRESTLQDSSSTYGTTLSQPKQSSSGSARVSQVNPTKQASTDNPPFRKGGLYMNLGALETPSDTAGQRNSATTANAYGNGVNYSDQLKEKGLVRTDTISTQTTITNSSPKGSKTNTYKSTTRSTYLTDLPVSDSIPAVAPQFNSAVGKVNSSTTNSGVAKANGAAAISNAQNSTLPELSAGKALSVADRHHHSKDKRSVEKEAKATNDLKIPAIKTWPPQDANVKSEESVQKKAELSSKIKSELKRDLRSSLGTDLEKGESVKAEKAQSETSNKVLSDSSSSSKADNGADKSGLAACPTLEYLSKEPYTVRLKFPSPVSYKAFRLDNPPRYVMDLDNVDLSTVATQEPEQNAFVKTIRFGNPEPTRGRIVFDLAQDKTRADTQVNANQDSFSISLSNDGNLFDGLSLKGVKSVVLDAGHGGSDPGAQRGDIQEKEITLAITNRLKRYLESRGIKVRMTRSDDTFVSLEDRVRICRESHPDAFVSIHINSLETDRDIKGIETYYQTEPSRALADKIHVKLVDGLKVPDRSVRKARFYVVNHSEQPAVLAEVGFISNKDERDKLISSDYQDKIAESVGQGVILFLTNPTEPAAPVISTSSSNNNLQFTNKLVPMLAKQGLSAIKQETKDAKDASIANTLMKQIAQDKRNPN